MNKGNIIFLNGVSSAGKSTLAKALQAQLTTPYFLLANDMFCDMAPETFMTKDTAAATCLQALHGMHQAIRAFSDAGIDVIVDHVMLTTDDTMEDCVRLLHDHPVLFVHVVCPLEELRRREIQRGDRDIGQAESQLLQLNPQDTYDITVDTHAETPQVCAARVIEALDTVERRAFTALWALQQRV